MELSKLNSQLKFVNRIGQNLSSEQIISLQSSVLKLSVQYKIDYSNFWGRIEGTIRNYYVVGVYHKVPGNFPNKKYFWSSQDFKFAQLPAQRSEYITRVKHMTDFFTGQHEKIIFKSNGTQQKAFNLNGQNFVVKAKNFTELDRLSIVVRLIDQECQVVPLGAYKMIPTHELIPNPNFYGLKLSQSTSLENYVHLRPPVNPQKKILIQCDKCLERDDFLDSLNNDPIKESWSVQTDESKTEITIRSQVWPGYVAYHRVNSPVFGGAYLGTGLMNFDLPFIV